MNAAWEGVCPGADPAPNIVIPHRRRGCLSRPRASSQRWRPGIASERKHLVQAAPDDIVAFAGALLEAGAVDDLDQAAPITDHAAGLQQARRQGYRGSPYAEHLTEQLLRQRDG